VKEDGAAGLGCSGGGGGAVAFKGCRQTQLGLASSCYLVVCGGGGEGGRISPPPQGGEGGRVSKNH